MGAEDDAVEDDAVAVEVEEEMEEADRVANADVAVEDEGTTTVEDDDDEDDVMDVLEDTATDTDDAAGGGSSVGSFECMNIVSISSLVGSGGGSRGGGVIIGEDGVVATATDDPWLTYAVSGLALSSDENNSYGVGLRSRSGSALLLSAASGAGEGVDLRTGDGAANEFRDEDVSSDGANTDGDGPLLVVPTTPSDGRSGSVRDIMGAVPPDVTGTSSSSRLVSCSDDKSLLTTYTNLRSWNLSEVG